MSTFIPWLNNPSYVYNLTQGSVVDEEYDIYNVFGNSTGAHEYTVGYQHTIVFRNAAGQNISPVYRYEPVHIGGGIYRLSFTVNFPANSGIVTMLHGVYGSIIDNDYNSGNIKNTIYNKSFTKTYDTGTGTNNPPPPQSSIACTISLDKTSVKVGESITATPNVTNGQNMNFLRWTTSEQAATPANGTPVSTEPQVFTFTSEGQKFIKLEVKDSNGGSSQATKTITVSKKKFLSKRMKIMLKSTSDYDGILGTDKTARNNNLFDALTAAKNDGQVMYFAPKQWFEAGKVVDFFKDTYNGEPCVAIIVERRTGDKQNGMESFDVTELPASAGSIFVTANNRSVNAFLLSSPGARSVQDLVYTQTYLQKEGLDTHPIVVYSQSPNKSKNAFGALATKANISFGQKPFSPALSTLRLDHYGTSGKKLVATGLEKQTSTNVQYRNVFHYRTKPFDNDYLRIRNSQIAETSSLAASNPDLFDPEDADSPWGKGDAPAAGASLVSYQYDSTDVTWGKAGILYRPATTGPETGVVWQTITAPDWGGVEGLAKAKQMMHIFDDYDFLYFAEGTIIDEDGTHTNQKYLAGVSSYRAPYSYSSIVKNLMHDYPSMLNDLSSAKITAMSNDKRYMIFGTGNRFYIYDSKLKSLLASNGSAFTSVSASEPIRNINKFGNLSLKVGSGLKQDVSAPGKFTVDINPELFNDCLVALSIDRDSLGVVAGAIKSGAIETPWTSTLSNGYSVKATVLDNYVFFNTKSGFGLFSYSKQSKYFYSVDPNTGDIGEEFENNKSTSLFSQVVKQGSSTISVPLLPANTQQTISLQGTIDSVPFGSNVTASLISKCKPQILRFPYNKAAYSQVGANGITITAQHPVIDRVNSVMLCPVSMRSKDDYAQYFATPESFRNGKFVVLPASEYLKQSGNFQMTLGLEASDGNWAQNTPQEMRSNFSTDFIIIDDDDVVIDITNKINRNDIDYINGTELRANIKVKNICHADVEEKSYNGKSTTFQFSSDIIPEATSAIASAFPGYDKASRLIGCWVVTNAGQFQITSVSVSNNKTQIIVDGNASSATGGMGVCALAPVSMRLQQTAGALQPKPAKLTIKSIDEYNEYYPVVIPVNSCEGNNIVMALTETSGYEYLRDAGVSFFNIPSGKSQFVSIAYYKDFDQESKILSNNLGYGVSETIFANRIPSTPNGKFYAFVSSVVALDTSKEISLKFVDSESMSALGSPYVITADNAIDDTMKNFVIEVTVEKNNFKFAASFEATTVSGNKITI